MFHGPPLTVLHRDEHLLAIDKPSGLLVHRGMGNDEVTALDRVRGIAHRHVHPVHRLDRGTSGVLLFALDALTASHMQRVFADGLARKTYVALVRGIPRETHFTVDHPVPRSEDGDRVPAITDFTVLRALGWFAWLEARPRTGRFHQVRRHAKHAGHPLVGDVNYGKRSINAIFREHYGLARLALHASTLAFTHPHTGEPIEISAPVPDDLANAIATLARELEAVRGTE